MYCIEHSPQLAQGCALVRITGNSDCFAACSKPIKVSEIMANAITVIVVDVQYDFCPPSGALAVPDGLEVIPVINELLSRVKPSRDESQAPIQVVYSQDWHPPGHVSFHSTHAQEDPAAELFQQYMIPSGQLQMLWPDHCVQDSHGAQLHHDLTIVHPHVAIRKGCHVDVDSYSAFLDVDGATSTGLRDEILSHVPHEAEASRHIIVAGLALDYCVGFTALDAKKLFPEARVTVLRDACRGVAEASTQEMLMRFEEAGIELATSASMLSSNV